MDHAIPTFSYFASQSVALEASPVLSNSLEMDMFS